MLIISLRRSLLFRSIESPLTSARTWCFSPGNQGTATRNVEIVGNPEQVAQAQQLVAAYVLASSQGGAMPDGAAGMWMGSGGGQPGMGGMAGMGMAGMGMGMSDPQMQMGMQDQSQQAQMQAQMQMQMSQQQMLMQQQPSMLAAGMNPMAGGSTAGLQGMSFAALPGGLGALLGGLGGGMMMQPVMQQGAGGVAGGYGQPMGMLPMAVGVQSMQAPGGAQGFAGLASLAGAFQRPMSAQTHLYCQLLRG